jgi:very-short-patch-repair endonuclease
MTAGRSAAVQHAANVTTKRLVPGVFVGAHAIGEGWLTAGQLRSRGYRRLVHGVYADPGLVVDHQLICRAVALLLPEGAVIGGHSAAAWYGAAFASPADPVTVLRPEQWPWSGPRGLRVHRTVLSTEDVVVVDDIPMTSALRTAWDVAALVPLATAVAALDAMVRAGHVTTPQLEVMAQQGTGRFGVTRLRRAVPLVDPRAESAPESKVRVALVMAGLEPVPQHEVWLDGRFLARVDLAWPDARVALEYEGAYHFNGTQIVRDDARIQRLVAAGWIVVRVSAIDLRNLDAVVRRVTEALAARRP